MFIAVILACLSANQCIYFVDETRTDKVECLIKLRHMHMILQEWDLHIMEYDCKTHVDETRAPILRFKTFN